MFGITAKVIQRPPTAEAIMKQIRFGTARGLTATAKEGQTAVQGAIKGKFRNRKTWFTQQSPIGIRIKAATPADPVAEIYTNAKFMPLQDTGGIKIPFGNHLAIPAATGPLAKKTTIPASLRPKALMNSGYGFILTTRNGTKLIMMRHYTAKGTDKGIIPMYVLVPRATIKAANVFVGPIETVLKRRLNSNIAEAIDNALKTAKY